MRKTASLLLAAAAGMAFMTPALAADLIIEEEVVEMGVVDVSGDWEGPYIGVHAGYAWGDADHTSGPGFNDMDLSGWLVGVQAGANFYITDGLLAGIEGDLSWADISGECDASCNTPGITHQIDWTGSVRGKLGFDGGAFMPYLTAGVAFANATREATDAETQTHIGWTAGAGVDVMVAEQISLNFEYRFTSYGEKEYDTGGIPPTIDLTTHQARVGLNFHF